MHNKFIVNPDLKRPVWDLGLGGYEYMYNAWLQDSAPM